MKTPSELGFRMPAEWEPHSATWIAWPHNRTDWPGKGLMVEWVFVEIARHVSRTERVRILVGTQKQEQRAERMLARSGVDLTRVDFVRRSTNRSWTRDYLPSFVTRRARSRREVAAVKWRFNGWARYDDFAQDEKTGAAVAKWLGARTFRPTLGKRRVVLEGGAIDVDGQGTLLATEQCLLSGPFARNRELGRAGTEKTLSEHLGTTRVVWLGDGIAGDGAAVRQFLDAGVDFLVASSFSK